MTTALDWRMAGACVGHNPELWHPPSNGWPGAIVRAQHARAFEICQGCPVRQECAEFGMTEDFGIFGGLWPHERRLLARREVAR